MIEYFPIGVALIVFGGILYAVYEAITHESSKIKKTG